MGGNRGDTSTHRGSNKIREREHLPTANKGLRGQVGWKIDNDAYSPVVRIETKGVGRKSAVTKIKS